MEALYLYQIFDTTLFLYRFWIHNGTAKINIYHMKIILDTAFLDLVNAM